MELQTTGLLSTFVVCLFFACAGGLLARSLKLPPLLGYLLAGVVAGPFTPGFVANQAVANDLASIGVALLLFNIGLHFSLKDLLAVRKIALVGGLLQVVFSTALGFFVVWGLLGRDVPAALLIGFSVAIASTAVSIRLLEERQQIMTFPGRVALGWLVLQDIVVIIALVMLPAFAHATGFSPKQWIATFGKALLQIAGFAFVMFLVGRRAIPYLLGVVAKAGSRELFTLAVIVIALGIAYGSSIVFGVSLALGAFFAGVVIGESDLNYHAASEALAMQQVFTILFFVSVGMLFDPTTVMRMPLQILALWAVVVFGMGGVSFLILVAMRLPMPSAALVGSAFAQIGEFSFVLSQLGMDWGILSRADRDLILATAIFTITLNPLLIAVCPRLARKLAAHRWVEKWYKVGKAIIPPAMQPLAEHVILVGHGRVGQIVASALQVKNIPYIVAESDRRVMEKLRHMQKPVVFGDAAREAVLRATHPETARLMILAVPEGAQARRIASLAKRLYPKLEVIARVHSEQDARALTKLGVELSVMGEREIAYSLSTFALRRYDFDPHDVLEALDALRNG